MEKMWGDSPETGKPEETTIQGEQEMTKEMKPELVEAVVQEVKKESGSLEKVIKKFPGLRKVALAMTMLTALGAASVGMMPETAEARDREYKRTGARAADRVVGGIADGLSKNLENIFERLGTGRTPREQARAIREQMRQEQRVKASYEKQRQMALRNYQNELKKSKTDADIRLAREKYQAAMQTIDEAYGIKRMNVPTQ